MYAGLFTLIALVLAALLAPVITQGDPTAQNLAGRHRPPGWADASGVVHYMGTDHLGRDLGLRVWHGLRVSLLVGLSATLVGLLLGGVLGLMSGYFGGRLDNVLMRIVDVQMSFPYILLAIIFAAVWGRGTLQIIVIIGVHSWVAYARIIRSSVLSLKEKTFVEAAHAVGVPTPKIVWRHIVPFLLAPALVVGTFQLGTSMILESTLGFLGLGINPPTPTLGGILSDGRPYLATAWWPVAFSGIVLAVIVLAVNLFGDGLRDHLDPRSR